MAEGNQIDKDQEDGSWFLEAVGAKKPAPSPIESIAELERENTLVDLPAVSLSPGNSVVESGETPEPSASIAAKSDVDVIEMTSFDGDPGTSLSTFDPVPDLPPMPSNVVAAIAVKAADESDVLSETVDESNLSAPLKTRRPFRWSAFGLVLAVIAAIVLGIVWLPKAANSAADATRTSYYDASLTVREFLPTAQASLDIATNPSSTDAALGTVIPVVSELTSSAGNLAAVAAEPLPTVLPFLSVEAVDELPPLQNRSTILASDASEVARQIGHAYVYRTSIADLLVIGDLPVVAGTEEINALSVVLATSLAENAALIADLPANDIFDDIAASATEAVGAYAQWQEDYLKALAEGDAAAAQALIDDYVAVRTALLAETAQALASFRETLDDRIVSLSAEFDEHLANLSR
jgi:hypothetical protein